MTSQIDTTAKTVSTVTPEANKAMIAAQDRALKGAIALTRENLTAAGKLCKRTIARAEDSITKAGLSLMWACKAEGEAYKAISFEYDKDVAPVVALAIAEAYESKMVQKTMRAYGKLFFLAGVHDIDTDETTQNKIVESFRDQLKAAGIIEEHGNDKAKRATRTSTANVEKARGQETVSPATPVAVPANASAAPSEAIAAPKLKPGKVYTDGDRRAAAFILTGSLDACPDVVAAFATHRDQVLKFIHQLVASAKA